MSFVAVGLALGAAGGIAKTIAGGVQKKKAKAAAAAAAAELAAQKEAFAALDTSNPYKNMENTMEDLTVNQEEAQFIAEQQQQSQANILQDLRGAAGGSGIAALAQTLANQGTKNARQAAVSIGKQEQANQLAERKEASRLQGLKREGDIMSRQMVADKTKTLMGMAADDYANKQEAVAQANQQMMEGISDIAGVGMEMATGGVGGGSTPGGVGGVTNPVKSAVDSGGTPSLGNLQMSGNFEGGLPEGLNYSLAGDFDQQHLYTIDPQLGY